jgi:hypothetical protein
MSTRTPTLRCHLFGHKWDIFGIDELGRRIRVCRRRACFLWQRETKGTT